MARGLFVVVFAVAVALSRCADDGDHATNGVEGATTGGSSGSGASGGSDANGGAGANGGSDGSSAGDGAGGDAASPYANVVAVVSSGEPGAYTLAVTVESSDVDCTQYADWWEVLSDGGSLVYRRVLEHSHTDENGTTDPDAPGNTFTRSGGPVEISADDVVIVRAHMSTGGYRGLAWRGSVAGGFAEASDIGPDFAADVEDDTPLPASCLF